MLHKSSLIQHATFPLKQCRLPTGAASHLDNRLTSNHLQNLPAPPGAIWQGQVDNLSIPGELIQNNSTKSN